eukprot:m.200735 g.200735  ORF g.200735 m.200735 type:complete len:320 (+) comp21166_c0_seq1:246-1205(+)
MILNLRDRQLTGADFLALTAVDMDAATRVVLMGNRLEADVPDEEGRNWFHHPCLTSVQQLIVSDCALTRSAWIARLPTTLVELKMGNNHMTSLHPAIGQLRQLKTLAVSSNQIVTIPPEIGKLTNLKLLGLANNRITTVPPELGQCHALIHLYLTNNPITALPDAFKSLQKLQTLDIRGVRCTEPPPVLVTLHNLRDLFAQDALFAKEAPFCNVVFAGASRQQLEILKRLRWSRRLHSIIRLGMRSFHITLCLCLAAARRAHVAGGIPSLPDEMWQIVFTFLTVGDFIRVHPRRYFKYQSRFGIPREGVHARVRSSARL